MNNNKFVLTYPELGNFDIPIKYFMDKVGINYIPPPRMTKKTIETGARYSPDFVCAPYKYMMGCYLEALEKGATVLVQTGEVCRLGYYGELHEQALRDMGYEFEMLNLTLYNFGSFIRIIAEILKRYSSRFTILKLLPNLPATAKILFSIDKIEDYYRKNMGFEIINGSFDKAYKEFLNALRSSKSYKDVSKAYKLAKQKMQSIKLNKPTNPIKIGVVGEFFTLIDTFSNLEIEKKIAKMGVEVYRNMTLSNSMVLSPCKGIFNKIKSYLKYDLKQFPTGIWSKTYIKECGNYVKYDTGSSSIFTIATAKKYADMGVDGLIHIKTFGCMPEMDSMPILNNISEDYNIPILYLSYDTQTGEAGIETRVEAFVDMVELKRKALSKEVN